MPVQTRSRTTPRAQTRTLERSADDPRVRATPRLVAHKREGAMRLYGDYVSAAGSIKRKAGDYVSAAGSIKRKAGGDVSSQ